MTTLFSLSRSAARGAVGVWLAAMLVLGSALLAKHVVALPAPAADQQLARKLAPLRAGSDAGAWLAIHVLYAECRCSRRVVTELLSAPQPKGWHELVLWAGKGEPPAGLRGRFRVERPTIAELGRLGIGAAPLLIVVDPQGSVHYVGGYTARKQGPELDYLRILSDCRRDERVASRPLFGCAMSDQLQRQLSLFTGL